MTDNDIRGKLREEAAEERYLQELTQVCVSTSTDHYQRELVRRDVEVAQLRDRILALVDLLAAAQIYLEALRADSVLRPALNELIGQIGAVTRPPVGQLPSAKAAGNGGTGAP